ncbi:hypothetical protein [Octadecabacter antarcticus]|uniref:hypothetical protein n=1 Tax=Octadecabacter antarcticus TaxID=1217908 RepID=UPI0005C4B88E|nr:hypothetical protein [Octadecabacter antarcticus]
MKLIRLLTIVMVVFSTSLSGVMAANHVGMNDMSIEAVDAMLSDQESCCQHSADRSARCHIMSAVIPFMMLDSSGPDVRWTISIGPSTFLIGIEPTTILDPPRTV